jgi:hypothetical protein
MGGGNYDNYASLTHLGSTSTAQSLPRDTGLGMTLFGRRDRDDPPISENKPPEAR